jgi:hypothetical protein
MDTKIALTYEERQALPVIQKLLKRKPEAFGLLTQVSNDRRRRGMVWCSQPNCVHGAAYRINVSGRLLCTHCASLLDKAELTILRSPS